MAHTSSYELLRSKLLIAKPILRDNVYNTISHAIFRVEAVDEKQTVFPILMMIQQLEDKINELYVIKDFFKRTEAHNSVVSPLFQNLSNDSFRVVLNNT